MSLVVVRPGVFTTLQDVGRVGHRTRGVPLGGVFDSASAGLANALVGNEAGCAVLELTYEGGTYEARAPLGMALAGAPMRALICPDQGPDYRLVPPASFSLDAGDRLVIGPALREARAYLAVRGGWTTPRVLGSRSTERPVRAGDTLPASGGSTPARRTGGFDVLPSEEGVVLRFVDGPDAGRVDPSWLENGTRYRVASRSDRMGIRLEGKVCEVDVDPERLSTPVSPGAVQIAGGLPLILGPACGTMGGYPHVAQVTTADLCRLAQARPGDVLRFERVSLAEARDLSRAWRLQLRARLALLRLIADDRAGVTRPG